MHILDEVRVSKFEEPNSIVFYERMMNLLSELEYLDYTSDYRIRLSNEDDRLFMQLQHWRKCVWTGKMDWGGSGKYTLSPYMTDGEILQMGLGMCLAYAEHEVRENFKWRGRALFSPHIDPLAHWEIADRIQIRDSVNPEG